MEKRLEKTIAIILPNYNYARYIKKSIQSIINQSRKPDQLIIIDDASTDNSLEIIEDLTKNLSFVKIIKNETNKGYVYSFNKAFLLVESDYVYSSASDDFISKDFIKEMMSFLEQNDDIALCFSLPGFFSNSKIVWNDDLGVYSEKILQPKETIKYLNKGKFWVPTHASVFKTSEIKKYRYEKLLDSLCDWFSVLKIVFNNKIGVIPKTLTFMHIREGTFSSKKKNYKDLEKIFSFLMKKISENKELKKSFLKSRILAALSKRLIYFLLLNVKYWKFIPGILLVNIRKIFFRINRKIKKIIKLQKPSETFSDIQNFLKEYDL